MWNHPSNESIIFAYKFSGRNSGVAFQGSPQMAQSSSIFTRDHVPYVE